MMNILVIIGLLMIGGVGGFLAACLFRSSSDENCKDMCPAVINRDHDIRVLQKEIDELKRSNASLRGINKKLYDQQYRQLVEAKA